MNMIVQVAVSQTQAPAPSILQRTGAIISQGGTTGAANTRTLLSSLADLTPLLSGTKAITTMVLSTGVVTVTTTVAHGIPNGDILPLTISGVTPAAYNGTFTCTITGASTFTFPLAGSPGAVTVQGVYTAEDVAELLAQVTEFFAQGSAISVYLLEFGIGDADDGVTALTAYRNANPNFFYAYLVPRYWAQETTFQAYVATFTSTTAKTYFYVTTTLSTYAAYTGKKSVIQLIESPTLITNEFSIAAAFWVALNYNPSPSNQVTPYGLSYLQAVTPYPIVPPQDVTFKTAHLNYVATGAQGGISNTLLWLGVTADGRPFNYWYSVDWVQINLQLNLTNEIINGSNNPLAPLYYDQAGIDRLQNRAQQVAKSAIADGLAIGSVILVKLTQADFIAALDAGVYRGQFVINAVPFTSYTELNPNDYALGVYNGLSAVYTPKRGFDSILFNVNVTDFA